MNGAYHAAKFGIEAVGDVFRQELRPWGISVSIVEPGSIATPIWERSEREIDDELERAPGSRGALRQAIERYRQGEQEARRARHPARQGRRRRSSTRSPHAVPAPATWSASTRSSRHAPST